VLSAGADFRTDRVCKFRPQFPIHFKCTALQQRRPMVIIRAAKAQLLYFCCTEKEKSPKVLYLQELQGIDPKQVTGIEPASPAWEAGVLPMNYTCINYNDYYNTS
jgi:hypothetical protein